jgi:phosphoribosylanthranilate isomerase
VWKAFPLSRGPADALAPYPVEAFVIDSGTTTRPGGTGQTADWGAAAEFVAASPRPVLLAGGLTPENVAQAVNRVRPWGVDVASGVESAPGRKDAARMREFVNRCRES